MTLKTGKLYQISFLGDPICLLNSEFTGNDKDIQIRVGDWVLLIDTPCPPPGSTTVPMAQCVYNDAVIYIPLAFLDTE